MWSIVITSIIPVSGESQFRACLDLRYAAYKSLGYLARDTVTDVDRFDCSSLHYAALDESQTIVGTVRLVMPKPFAAAIEHDLERVERWCLGIRNQYGIMIDRSNSLPVLETLEHNKLPPSLLGAKRPAELSRIIVAPQARGRHISRALVDTVVKQARLLDRDVLVLECIASDISLYRQYEFEPVVSSLVYPHLIVKEEVITMSRKL